MANELLTPDVIAREALMQLENQLVAAQLVWRDQEAEFGETKVGDSVRIRRPVQYTVREGPTAVAQDTVEGSQLITVDKQRGVDIEFSSVDLTLSIDQFSERYVTPAMIQLGNRVDADVLALYKDIYNWVGTPGQVIDSFTDYALGPERMDELAMLNPRSGVLAPADNWGLITNFSNTNALERVGMTALEKAALPLLGGVEAFMSQNVATHTIGDHGGTPLVDGAAQDVLYPAVKDTWKQDLITDGWDTSVDLKHGDIFTIADVFAVNPVTKEPLQFLQQFVVMADVTTNASAAADTTISISPPIIDSGPYQTVSAVPADDAVITYLGTANTNHRQNMTFHKSAFSLAMVPMELPVGANFKGRESANGLSVRVISVYDGIADTSLWRFDVLYGVITSDQRMAVRQSGLA